MTNHPRRQRDDEPSIEKPEPAGIPPQGSAEVAAHTGNGVPPGLQASAAKIIGETVAGALAQVLPQAMFSALTAALSQVPVQAITQQHMCAECITQRIMWENSHRPEMEKALEFAAQAAGIELTDPQAGRLDLAAFLPPDLRPGERNGMPNIQQAVTAVQGTEVCAMHIPGVQAARQPLLVASAAMSPAMLGQLTGAR